MEEEEEDDSGIVSDDDDLGYSVEGDEEDDDSGDEDSTHFEVSSITIPSDKSIKYLMTKANYLYACVSSEAHPEGTINWEEAIGVVISGNKVICTPSYKDKYSGLFVFA